MSALNPAQRSLLEKTVRDAREAAESAARATLRTLAVDQPEPFAALSRDDRRLRNQLRAEARRLGDPLESEKENPFPLLAAEVAYEHWHRMLFARFLAENGLLVHPSGVAVTLSECAELAADEGEPDAWAVAARYAARMLPGIFRNDDPALRLRFAPEGRAALERLIDGLPAEIFTADDSLGWVYQFWQARRKKEVNERGQKVSGADIAAVTQLFTEHYMVQFLLHNTLGAWWSARHPGEALPTDCEYLRRLEDGAPAAGNFPGWPDRAADLRILDPCCGSGHFLVAAFALMTRFRMEEEGLTVAEAGDAVIRENLFGLEIDPRCTQLAAFNLALAAWKSGSYRELPLPSIACSGLPVGDRMYEWTQLADGDPDVEEVLRRLYRLFREAPDLGSLIDPSRATAEAGMFAPDWAEVAPLLERALLKEKSDDPATAVFGEAVRGALRAARILWGKYHLVTTNVPYLARSKQDPLLQNHCAGSYPDSKGDLATVFVERCITACEHGGTIAVVVSQSWLFLGSYLRLREKLLRSHVWNLVARLGPGAFETIGGEVVSVALFVLSNVPPGKDHRVHSLDALVSRKPSAKATTLRAGVLRPVCQISQLRNPLSTFVFAGALDQHANRLLAIARGYQGISTADDPRFVRSHWEFPALLDGWEWLQDAPDSTRPYGGRTLVLLWDQPKTGLKSVVTEVKGAIRGREAWGKRGVTVSRMHGLYATLYTGELYKTSNFAIVPTSERHVLALWTFCSSSQFAESVRTLNPGLAIDNGIAERLPIDLEYWQKVAEGQYPNGLPEPHSDDPTQWLFHGDPTRATEPLQAAVALLLAYRWPRQQGMTVSGAPPVEDDRLGRYADPDGIVCLPRVAGEPPAGERLRTLLAAAYPGDWSPEQEQRLLAEAEFGGRSLEEWLGNEFFAQHCRVFHNRPFIWHLWDGRKDGFSALVNYHRLDRARLERLVYTYLGDWIRAQREADARGEAGANGRLAAALDLQRKLVLILEGEPPHDIYVRWKPLARQPLGWEPDLNDGVRLNIRPFVTAGVLRAKFTVHWKKDRGLNADGSERINDRHFTRAEKEAARRAAV